jgi:hypothetical protein
MKKNIILKIMEKFIILVQKILKIVLNVKIKINAYYVKIIFLFQVKIHYAIPFLQFLMKNAKLFMKILKKKIKYLMILIIYYH